MAKVAVQPNGCWFWTGFKEKGGYGRFRDVNKLVYAHVWAYRHWVGPVPDGLDLDHFKCHTPCCANPHHVRPATRLENVRNGVTHNAVKTHCKHGHEFTDDNTYFSTGKDGYLRRDCRQCIKIRLRRSRAKHEAHTNRRTTSR
jgi:hypothetical protein